MRHIPDAVIMAAAAVVIVIVAVAVLWLMGILP